MITREDLLKSVPPPLALAPAMVRGPMLPGIVSLWEPIDGPARGIPYIVFAGNVGTEESLADVTDKLSN